MTSEVYMLAILASLMLFVWAMSRRRPPREPRGSSRLVVVLTPDNLERFEGLQARADLSAREVLVRALSSFELLVDHSLDGGRVVLEHPDDTPNQRLVGFVEGDEDDDVDDPDNEDVVDVIEEPEDEPDTPEPEPQPVRLSRNQWERLLEEDD